MKKSYSLFFCASMLFMQSSCDPNRVYDQYEEIPDGVWNFQHPVNFEYSVTDTLQANDFYINIRYSGGYPFRNLFLFITTINPDGTQKKDTLECTLADDKGKYLGSGLGDIWDIQIPFRQHVQFQVSGKYKFEITHGMRIENLPLIMEIGLRIEKAAVINRQ